MQNTQETQSQIANLDSIQVLRGVAAFFIVIFHAFQETSHIYPESAWADIRSMGFIYGIDLFFVISGFIMVYTSPKDFSLAAAKHFMLRRLIRIVPLYWFFITLLVAASFVFTKQLDYLGFNIVDVIKTYFFIPYYNLDGELYPFYKVGWTLNYEMYFYALFALMMIIPKRFFMMAMTLFLFVPVLFKDSILPDNAMGHFLGAPVILNFLNGIWIGFLFKKGLRLPEKTYWLALILMITSIVWILFDQQIREMTGLLFPKKTLAALTILFVVLPKAAELRKLPKPLLFLGDSSYSLYLSHSFAIGVLVLCLGYVSMPVWLFYFLCVFLSIIAGSVTYLLIEKPLLSASKRLILSRNKE